MRNDVDHTCRSCGAERGNDVRPDCIEEKIRRGFMWAIPREGSSIDPYGVLACIVTRYYVDNPADLGGES